MPLTYVNPAPAPRKHARGKRASTSHKDWGRYGRRSRAAAKAAPTRPRRKKNMARKKLHGAAALAHARKRAKTKRRRGASRRRPSTSRRRKRRATARTSAPKRRRRRSRTRARRARRVRPGTRPHARRARRTRARRRRAVAMVEGRANPAPRRRRRRRHNAAASHAPRRRRRRNPARRMRSHARRRRYRRNPRPSTQRSILRARRAIRNRYKTALGRATIRRYRMRSNPGGVLMDTLTQAVPIALSLYGARAVSYTLASRVPGINRLPSQWQGTAMAIGLGVIGHFATKKVAKLAKYRTSVMIGLGLNLLDNALSAIAPASVKAKIGLGDVYADGLGDYVGVNGAPPIDDNITMGDYVEVGDYLEVGAEEELGQVEEELGLEEELGADAYLGGQRQGNLLAPIKQMPALEAVPARSFTKAIPNASAAYDNPRNLYGGVFAGGFGG